MIHSLIKAGSVVFFLAGISACNHEASRNSGAGPVKQPEQQDTATAVRIKTPTPDNNVSGCYRHTRGRDTLLVQLVQNGGRLAGRMRFDNYQIDGSMGTVTGNVSGDTLFLWYDFLSEGMRSVREMIFMKKGEDLMMAEGPFTLRGYSTLLNHIELKYAEVLQQVQCKDISRQLAF